MDRFEINFHILKKWLYLHQNRKTLISWFRDNLIRSAAVYGLGDIEELLEIELEQMGIPISYGIDRKAAEKKGRNFPIYDLQAEHYPETDAVIVTTASIYWDIVNSLKDKVSAPIVAIDDIISYCLSERWLL